MEFEGIVVNMGLRGLRWSPNTEMPQAEHFISVLQISRSDKDREYSDLSSGSNPCAVAARGCVASDYGEQRDALHLWQV